MFETQYLLEINRKKRAACGMSDRWGKRKIIAWNGKEKKKL